MNIAIAEAYQGQGIGKQVLAEVIAIAKNRGAKTLTYGGWKGFGALIVMAIAGRVRKKHK